MGSIILLNNMVVMGRSKRTATVADSTMVAEWFAMSMAAHDTMFLRQLLESMGFPQDNASQHLGDNQGALAQVRNPGCGRAKHVYVKLNWMAEQVKLNKLAFAYCPTKEMIADIMTKQLAVGTQNALRSSVLVNSDGKVIEEECCAASAAE